MTKRIEIIASYFPKHQHLTDTELAVLILENEDIDAQKDYLRRSIGYYRKHFEEMVNSNVTNARLLQKQKDINRIKNKSFRENSRIVNALQELSNEMVKVYRRYNLKEFVKVHKDKPTATHAGILQFSDAHFNELIDLPVNHYDFEVASARCKLFVEKSIGYLKANNVEHVVMACTGDLLNSDRRLDEILNQATNRAKACFLTIQIMTQMILHLNQHFKVTLVMVSGNESRIKQDIEWSELAMTDNYDFIIYHGLKHILADNESISFIDGDPSEKVINVMGHNILLMHGNQKFTHSQEGIQKVFGKYNKRGINLHYALFGHIHASMVTDLFARSSSLSGGNAYSNNNLQLASQAAQNLLIVSESAIDVLKIDLQNVDINDRYKFQKLDDVYNPKRNGNTGHHVIYEIVI